jgi:hypothetical protein
MSLSPAQVMTVEPSWVALTKVVWGRGARFLPNWLMKKLYQQNKLGERIHLFPIGGSSGGPQFHVKPGRTLGVETNEVVVFNLLPLPVDLENMHLEVLLGGMQLASKDVPVYRRIGEMSKEIVNLRFELTDNQAAMARNYEGPPILQMGITGNFRTHHGLVPLRYDVMIRTILYS